ncbi:MAG TPA: hypothetical protein VM143_17510 [Acidimicrobiales bacterium]|nr:hypothetical protein [Acidimicrobiales bacterium]
MASSRSCLTVAAACLWAATTLTTSACTAPVPTARSGADYDRKAAHTAEEVRSAVETARVALRADGDGRVFSRTLDVLVTEAEGDAGGAAKTFLAIDPKGPHADDTRHELASLLGDATATLADVRIAVRRGDAEELHSATTVLAKIADALEAFIEDVG